MLFLDSSIPEEIAEIGKWGVISGITTNPLIISRECGNVDLRSQIARILEVSTGHVSVELTAETEPEMLEEALAYHEWDRARVCIKVPFSEAGLKVAYRLVAQNVPVNLTCMMSFNQIYLAALTGATYASLFMGRVRDMGYDALPIIHEVRTIIERELLPTKIIIGSIRQMADVNEALQAGAHIVTVPPPILRKMLWNPNTERTIEQFNQAWRDRAR